MRTFFLHSSAFKKHSSPSPINDEIIQQQSATIDSLTNELALLREQVAYLTQKLYGKSSEKSVCPSGQLNLFEEESPSEEDGDVPS
ncbi:putative transposase remnant (pseudogene) [Streptococcus pneumoniae]|nr:putative transposase remnant (pseudogene) [Streptococcus pneumoniae]